MKLIHHGKGARAESESGYIKTRASVEILKIEPPKLEKRKSRRLESTPRHKKEKEIFPRSLASIIEKDGKEFEPVVHSFDDYVKKLLTIEKQY